MVTTSLPSRIATATSSKSVVDIRFNFLSFIDFNICGNDLPSLRFMSPPTLKSTALLGNVPL